MRGEAIDHEAQPRISAPHLILKLGVFNCDDWHALPNKRPLPPRAAGERDS